ncbi:MAG TPA: redoxin domain-containing protein [Ignavibacteriaceae bacterium]|nr:redoxin domain-containing protein [Ignavibacteriaceae bacterium]
MLRKTIIILFFILPIAVIAVLAISKSDVSQNSTAPSKITVENFTLTDIYKKKHSLSDYDNSKAIVIIFIATQCPVSNAYNSRMAALHKKYGDKNIAILGINSNKEEDLNECKSHAEKNGFKFHVLKDEKNVIADMFEAGVTPEVYVLQPKTYKVLYHGRIDDSRDKDNVEAKDLENALDEILAGKKVSITQTKAFGCTIKRI